MKDGRYLANGIQASEKVYESFRLEVTNAGGHSSLPRKDNAIYRLAAGLGRLAAFDFPVRLGEVTRALPRAHGASHRRARSGRHEGGAAQRRRPTRAAVAACPRSPSAYNALMRTTCVATRLEGGHAENALPQMARAIVNCRTLPGTPAGEVQATLVEGARRRRHQR